MNSPNLSDIQKLYNELTEEINRWRKMNLDNILQEQKLKNERDKFELERSTFEMRKNNTLIFIESEYRKLHEISINVHEQKRQIEYIMMKRDIKKRVNDEAQKIIEDIANEYLWTREL